MRLVVIGGLVWCACGDNLGPAGPAESADGAVDVDAEVDAMSLPTVPPIDASDVDAAASVLVIEPAAVDFGRVEIGATAIRRVSITNPSSSDVALASLDVTGLGLSRASTTCGAALAAGARCEVVLRFAPTGLGAASGALAIASDRGAASVAIDAAGAGRIRIAVDGAGTVSGPDLSCRVACTTLATGPVTLRATAAAGARWSGWTTGCGVADTCVVRPAPWPVDVGARFAAAADAPVLSIALEGAATGDVVIRTGGALHRCPGECALTVPRGAGVELFATTPSVFAGWSGPCAGNGRCTLRVNADTAVAATFDRERGEVWTVLTPDAGMRPAAVAFERGGGLRVVSSRPGATRLFAMTAAGAVTWSVPITSAITVDVLGLEADRDGDALVWTHEGPAAGGSRYALRKVSPTGAVLWTRSFASASTTFRGDHFYDDLAVTPAGDAAVVLDGLRLISRDGAIGRAVPIAEVRALAVDSRGDLVVAARSSGDLDPTAILRFSAAGDALPPLGTLVGFDAELTVDSGDAPVAVSSTRAQIAVQRLGERGFVITNPVRSMRNLPAGIAVDGADNIDDVHWQNDGAVAGMVLRQLDPTGAQRWLLDKPVRTQPWGTDGVTPYEIAADRSGRLALVGRWAGNRPGWITVYQPAP